MTVADPTRKFDNVYTIKATSRKMLPNVATNHTELCTMREFADTSENEDLNDGEVFVGFKRCTDAAVPDNIDENLYAGTGPDDPRAEAVLADITDVLVSNLPPGMPPERYGQDGKPIEHTIDLDPNSKPYAAQPRRLTPEENAEKRRALTQLLENGWVAPSLSPHAAPVVFARKKPDPVTGVSALRMCISYVKLNRNTLNKIAHRLPRIAEMLDQVTSAS
jgi:hypothetical protein